jgi:hypothetical protein
MALVIDASIVAAWAFAEDHGNAELTLARIRTEEALVPGLWWYELRNVLVIGERRGTAHRTGNRPLPPGHFGAADQLGPDA